MKSKKLYPILWMAVAVLLATACEEETVEIVTLNKAGDTFYFREKVPVWLGVSGDLSDMTYEWECTGGSFSGRNTQSLYENLWVAPAQPGIYIVKATARNGNQKDTRETAMKVTNYFTETFDQPTSHVYNNTVLNVGGWTSSNTTWVWLPTSGVQISCNGSNTNAPRITSATLSSLFPPYSFGAEFKYTNHRSVTDATAARQGTVFCIVFAAHATIRDKPYIRELRWIFSPSPAATTCNWALQLESFVPNTGRSTVVTVSKGVDSRYTFPANTEHRISVTLDADFNLSLYVDGAAVIDKSNAIPKFYTDRGMSREEWTEMKATQFKFDIPGRTNTTAATLGETTYVITKVQINDQYTAIGGDVNNVGFEEIK
jgi:hypothetical protein